MNNSPTPFKYAYWIKEIGKCLGKGQTRDALFCINKAIESAQTDTERAEALNFMGSSLFELERYEEALSVYEEVLKAYRDKEEKEEEPFLKEHVAKAFFGQIFVLSKLEREAEAASLCDSFVSKFGGEEKNQFIRKQVIKALLQKGAYFAKLGQQEQGIASYGMTIYDDVIRRCGTEVSFNLFIAEALIKKGELLSKLNRKEEALSLYDEIVHRFGNETDIELKQQVAEALYLKAFALFGLKRYKEALSNFINTYGNTEELSLKRKTALALLLKRK